MAGALKDPIKACPQSPCGLLFLGGNGHCAARLEPARRALADRARRIGEHSFHLLDTAYPGFEGRPRAPHLQAFLDSVEEQLLRGARAYPGASLIYATGIGGLLGLCLRARGGTLDLPLLLQAPVLWGLERRWMPTLMRLRHARRAASRLFVSRAFTAWFRWRHLPSGLDPAATAEFFAGYACCGALADLFDWLRPSLLRDLEARFSTRPQALSNVSVWWGGRDRVVTTAELRLTEATLRTRWPLRVFDAWGHYPMLEDPVGWVEALAALLQPPLTGGRNTSSSPSFSGVSKGA